ncbi:hypothetical protein CBP27_05140 [Fischerella thermalis WC542]|jgi:hypothetical protein|nr:hypothetical protein CBP19_13865 [Fischerella thermalis WC1110]PLZ13332.1 hypothetical protein CBP18_04895 [Fischerella thermalis WC119]PLZ20453.1 hypothetical protein CBP29_17215 [Fischerella thermalis WC341]PLZ33397.1 hypothetical protein CBP28_03735 [Fischerella thermalis WC559]PLZ34827.1 hypothetical protein CBP10_05145 [Fischerella thermalis WC558]PLZ37587.1 hypothetical protein CBP26_17740 [Fischerella thermalis WC538]PLZ41789.1 hypothetical protein CBP27_05140 [Fischerella thermalis
MTHTNFGFCKKFEQMKPLLKLLKMDFRLGFFAKGLFVEFKTMLTVTIWYDRKIVFKSRIVYIYNQLAKNI